MMRTFANFFLLLFLADGGISLLDKIASLVTPVSPLAPLTPVLASLVAISADLIYLCLAVDRRLPKRVFLPLIAYLFLVPVTEWLFPSLGRMPAFGIAAAAGQIGLLLAVTRGFRKGNDRTVTLPEELFTGPSFSIRNTLGFTAANIVVVPCVLVLGVLVAADSYMQKYTSGFMRLAPDGLHMMEKVYRRGDKTVRLAGMIHMGEKAYYDQVMQSVAPGRTVVLAEGVSDSDGRLHERPDYGKLAGYLGLSTQQEEMHFKGRKIRAADLEKPAPRDDDQVDILRADVDISSFRPTTIWFLEELGKQMRESKTLSRQLMASIAWSEKNMTPEIEQAIMDDILHRRNQVLIGHLRNSLRHYDNVVVPWGALHMAEVEEEVLREGFRLQQVNDRVSIRFLKEGRGVVPAQPAKVPRDQSEVRR